MLSTLALSVMALSWHVRSIDLVSTKTTIRLWHELFARRRVSHDFVDLLSPRMEGEFVALVRYDEVHAIAQCETIGEELHVRRIAYSPMDLHANASFLLLAMLHDEYDDNLHATALKAQPRLLFESAFLRAT